MGEERSTCINHPYIPATARCKQCHKPLCDTCKVAKPGGFFCGDNCHQNYQAFQARAEMMDARESRARGLYRGYVLPLIPWVVLAVLCYYIFIVQGVRSVADFVDMIKRLAPL